ncbi:hypothetical protein DL93DRAFT_2163886, partial [Clavulina sp. PMI_390]
MAVAHRLPAELLIKIFYYLIRDFRTWKQYPDLMSLRFTLGAVCSRWRSIALSMAALWASISIGGAHENVESYPASLDLFKLHLERSGSTALLVIRFFECPQALLEQLWAALDPHFSRIRSMNIITINNDFSHLLPIPRGLKLETLTYAKKARYVRRLEFEFDLLENALDAPSLRNLDVENISWKALSSIPLEQLRSLRLSLPTTLTAMPVIHWRRVFEILHQCVSLIELHANLVGSVIEGIPAETIDLPNLERLTTYHPELPSHLRTPKLEVLYTLKGGAACDPQQPLPCLTMYVAKEGLDNLEQWRMPDSFAAVQHLHFERCSRSVLMHIFRKLVQNNALDGVHLTSFPHLHTLSLSD